MDRQAGIGRGSILLVALAALVGAWLLLESSGPEAPGTEDDGLLVGDAIPGPDAPPVAGVEPLPRTALSGEDLRARGPLPASVQIASARDWRLSGEDGSPDLGPFWDEWFGRGEPEAVPPVQPLDGEPVDGEPVHPQPRPAESPAAPLALPVPSPDGDGVLRVLHEAFEGRVPLRFESAESLETFRARRLRVRPPHSLPVEALVDLCGEELGFWAVALDGALYFRAGARPHPPGAPPVEIKEDK